MPDPCICDIFPGRAVHTGILQQTSTKVNIQTLPRPKYQLCVTISGSTIHSLSPPRGIDRYEWSYCGQGLANERVRVDAGWTLSFCASLTRTEREFRTRSCLDMRIRTKKKPITRTSNKHLIFGTQQPSVLQTVTLSCLDRVEGDKHSAMRLPTHSVFPVKRSWKRSHRRRKKRTQNCFMLICCTLKNKVILETSHTPILTGAAIATNESPLSKNEWGV
ncbi:hypothetical protein AOLI_G00028170 [Acnodon oligacanthus]